jgi:uncharacterized RDD family membrane protein YckC
MRCPKCHYLSFEPEPRCKNCGYDLSFDDDEPQILEDESAAPDDVIKDFVLHRAEPGPRVEIEDRIKPVAVAVDEPAPPTAPPAPPPPPPLPRPVPVTEPAELPLFVQAVADAEPDLPPIELEPEEPLVRLPRAPRPPLSVRRPTPAPGRVRERYEQRGLLEEKENAKEIELLQTPEPAAVARAPLASPIETASAMRRIAAAGIDLMFIGSLNAAVIWLTLERCDLTFSEVTLLPILPIAAFLFLLDGGYLLMFTATNGQTIGKMAAGIRVVGDSDGAGDERVSFGQAFIRAVLTFPSLLAFGAGFLPALLGKHLALHDRFSHTRVVRA